MTEQCINSHQKIFSTPEILSENVATFNWILPPLVCKNQRVAAQNAPRTMLCYAVMAGEWEAMHSCTTLSLTQVVQLA